MIPRVRARDVKEHYDNLTKIKTQINQIMHFFGISGRLYQINFIKAQRKVEMNYATLLEVWSSMCSTKKKSCFDFVNLAFESYSYSLCQGLIHFNQAWLKSRKSLGHRPLNILTDSMGIL